MQKLSVDAEYGPSGGIGNRIENVHDPKSASVQLVDVKFKIKTTLRVRPCPDVPWKLELLQRCSSGWRKK